VSNWLALHSLLPATLTRFFPCPSVSMLPKLSNMVRTNGSRHSHANLRNREPGED
jgi:hypothetical protein